jgi:GNAT superfamily N-acetyltransferase
VAIWREVALWLIERGQPLWSVEQFDDASTAAFARAGQLALGFDCERPVAVMTIQDEDRLFWPEAATGSALYLHKLAVRRSCAGQGWSRRLIEWAAAAARERAAPFLRLDCDPRPELIRLYERRGFARIDDEPVARGGFASVRFERAV